MTTINYLKKTMFEKEKHKTILVKILKEIYSDPLLRNILGFKGGTAALLFYNLPRISVDLDFDLLEAEKKNLVLAKMKKILLSFGDLLETVEKRQTLFFLLSYGKGEKKIKIEISKRLIKTDFEVKSYLGIPVLVIEKSHLIAGKLSAFLTRRKFASRDLFDLWFFLKNDGKINEEFLRLNTGYDLKKGLRMAIKKLETIKSNKLLQGLGELVDEEQKNWVKNKLKEELIFYLKAYLKESVDQ